MAKSTEIKAILAVFQDPDYENWDEEEAADKIRTALLGELKKQVKENPAQLEVGLAFKFPWSTVARHVAYMNDEFVWVTESSSRYGGLIPVKMPGWSLITPSSAKNGGAGENKLGITVGEILSINQDKHRFRVVQTHPNCVLMENSRGRLQVEPNDVLSQFFRRMK